MATHHLAASLGELHRERLKEDAIAGRASAPERACAGFHAVAGNEGGMIQGQARAELELSSRIGLRHHDHRAGCKRHELVRYASQEQAQQLSASQTARAFRHLSLACHAGAFP